MEIITITIFMTMIVTSLIVVYKELTNNKTKQNG
jgi:hypothetical protein